jgi:predicted acetyltransferase
MSRNFGDEPRPEGNEHFLRNWEPERSFCAYEDGTMVATSGAFSLELTVPGSAARAGGTTMVSVQTTHRRQGVLRNMMSAHLRDVTDRGEPLAALWASEDSIYGRFGFGTASLQTDLTIPHHFGSFHRLAPSPAAVRLIELDAARKELPLIYDRVRSVWPGFYDRKEGWWEERWFYDDPDRRGGFSRRRYAVTTDGDGYVVYRQKSQWERGNAAGELTVLELIGTTPESWAGLWRFALDHDLTTEVKAYLRSTADPILGYLEAPRRASLRPTDGIWVRVHDPVIALAARRYQIEGRIVFEIHDPFFDRTIKVELEGGPDGAECRVTKRPPDLVLDMEDLGACYLGWARFRSLARGGRVGGERQSLAKADIMFGWDPVPWCPEIF